jgi:glutathione S-transferase
MKQVPLLVPTLSLQLTCAVTMLLFLKLFVSLSIQGGKRFKAGTRPPEDAQFGDAVTGGVVQGGGFSGGPASPASAAEDPASRSSTASEPAEEAGAEEARWNRIIANDLENIPIGLVTAWASLLAAGASQRQACATAHNVCVLVFLVGRVGHTYCYAHKLQPARTYAWTLALLGVMAMAFNCFAASILAADKEAEL